MQRSKKTSGFSLIECICMVLLLACMAVVALSMSDTFIHSLSVARDVAASKVSQQQFRIALQKMLSNTRYSVCYIDSLRDLTGVDPRFPYMKSAALIQIGSFRNMRANLDSAANEETLQIPLSVKKYSIDVVQGKGAPSRVDFLFLSEIPYSEGLSLDTVLRLAIGRLVIDNAKDSSNNYMYTYVKLYKGTGGAKRLNSELDENMLVASYRIRLRDDVGTGAFINYITYWPHLQLYTVPLPSNLSYLAEASKTQLNVYRYGVFNPDIITLP